jgi:membrane fusion protein
MPAAPIAWNVFGAFLIAATAALIIFISTASYARKETATGSLISTAGVVRVSARNGGVVTDLGITEGDRVEVGQALFTIDSQQGLESGGTLASALIASLDAQIRLINQQIDSEPKRIAGEIVRLDAEIENVKAQREAVASQRALQAQLIATADERQRALAQLYQKGSATKVALQQQQGVHLATRQSLADLDRQFAASERELEQARRQREQLPVQQNERLSQLRLSLADRERERTEAAARGAQVVRSPIDGRVTALQVNRGQIVDANRPLLTLVPEHAQLRAELFVPSRAIGFVKPGQQVRLMIDAFPFQHFGVQKGIVESVSQTILAPNEIFGAVALKEPAYRVAVRLDRQTLEAYGQTVPLQPDMSLQADIVLEERSLIAWLFNPLLSARGRM